MKLEIKTNNMKQELIKAEDYGLEAAKANELTGGLNVAKAERELLIKEFKEVSKLELTQENLPKFKDLRLRIVKNRTQGVDLWHKKGKEVSLRLGQFYDAVKRMENQVNQSMEEKLMSAEKHFEKLEQEMVLKLQEERVSLLSEFMEGAHERDLAAMDQDVWESYLATKKKEYIDIIAAEKKAEEERIQAERIEKLRWKRSDIIKLYYNFFKDDNSIKLGELSEVEFDVVLTNLKRKKDTYDKEQEQIRLDNERLRKQAALVDEQVKKDREAFEAKLKTQREEKERIEHEETAKCEKLEAQLKAKEDAELKAKEQEQSQIQLELNKGDSDKVKDLKSDLIQLKSKYTFKSKKNQKMYSDVGVLIEKVINHING